MDVHGIHHEAVPLLEMLVGQLGSAFGPRLLGVYLFGSLVTGDFHEGVSDIDVVVAHAGPLGDDDLGTLAAVHDRVTQRFPSFENRLDVNYFEEAALRRYDARYAQGRISPGEPFHRTTVGSDWILNRWQLREHGIALVGPPPAGLVDPIDGLRLRSALRAVADEWWSWIEQETKWPRPLQSYAVLTTCRILHASERGEIVSKRRAAAWARATMASDHAAVVRDAWEWRSAWREPVPDASSTLPRTLAFLVAARERMAAQRRRTDIVAAGYEALGERYSAWAAATEDDPRPDWLAALAAMVPAHGRVLDLGCGPGLTTSWLTKRFAVTALDVSAAQIELARRAAPRAQFLVGDMRAAEFPARSFDAVVALFSLIHLPIADLGLMLGRIAAWLRPRGALFVALGSVEGEGVQADWLGVPMFFSGTTPERNRLLLRDAGFVLDRDEVVTVSEPEEGDAAFHWLLARRSDLSR